MERLNQDTMHTLYIVGMLVSFVLALFAFFKAWVFYDEYTWVYDALTASIDLQFCYVWAVIGLICIGLSIICFDKASAIGYEKWVDSEARIREERRAMYARNPSTQTGDDGEY